MGFSLGQVTRAIQQGEHDVARAIVTGMEEVGHEGAQLGRALINKLPGGMHLGSKLFGGGHHVGRSPAQPFLPTDKRAPKPGDFPIITTPGGSSICGGSAYSSKYGAGQPFALIGFKSLAAGAQTQGTDLIDFHAAASNPTIISSDDLIPGNVEIFELSVTFSPRLTTTLGFEGAGFIGQCWIIEYINGIEKARWSITDLALTAGGVGLLTSGAVAYAHEFSLPNIPWHRKYDPNVKTKTALQIGVTTTTVSALDVSFIETGIRP